MMESGSALMNILDCCSGFLHHRVTWIKCNVLIEYSHSSMGKGMTILTVYFSHIFEIITLAGISFFYLLKSSLFHTFQ